MSDFITILGFILPGIVGGLIGYFASLSNQVDAPPKIDGRYTNNNGEAAYTTDESSEEE